MWETAAGFYWARPVWYLSCNTAEFLLTKTNLSLSLAVRLSLCSVIYLSGSSQQTASTGSVRPTASSRGWRFPLRTTRTSERRWGNWRTLEEEVIWCNSTCKVDRKLLVHLTSDTETNDRQVMTRNFRFCWFLRPLLTKVVQPQRCCCWSLLGSLFRKQATERPAGWIAMRYLYVIYVIGLEHRP